MRKIDPQKIFRVIDVNLNRCKEGLRVNEDIFRFILEDNLMRKKIRLIRHEMDRIAEKLKFKGQLFSARNASADQGRAVDDLEFKRKDIPEVLFANFQRVKESLRVLEEFLKIADPKKVALAKKNRYLIYELEQKVYKKYFSG